MLAKALFVSDIMSDMKKTVTLRSLRRDAALLDIAAEGEEIVVTRFGKPYVRIHGAVFGDDDSASTGPAEIRRDTGAFLRRGAVGRFASARTHAANCCQN